MDLGTIVGLGVGLGGVLFSVVLEGGSLKALVNIPAAVLVLCGTYGATIACCSLKTFLRSPLSFLKALQGKTPNRHALVEQTVEIATRARREGLLALEGDLDSISNDILRKALRLVIDGMDPEMVSDIMDTELRARKTTAKEDAEYYVTWGGLGPTLGVTGTVMGLVNMMSNLDDPSTMGPAISAAFCATLYGVATANLIFIPIGKKLTLLAAEDHTVGEMLVEGVRAIQEGASPLAVRERLSAYLAGHGGGKSKPAAGGGTGGGESAELQAAA